MSFRSLARDLRDSIGSLSRRSFDVRLYGKSHGAVHELHDQPEVIQTSCWANLPPELLSDVIKRLEESESTWPSRKHVVACAAVCRSWREMCKEIVQCPEFCGKLTFPVSLKQPGFRDGTMQCFIKRDKSKLTYQLFLCLSPALLVENGKFLLSAKRVRRTTCTEYVISMDADNISRSSNSYIGKVRSNFLGTKFIIYDTQPPPNISNILPPGPTSRRFYLKKVSPKLPSGSYNIAQVSYELNVLGTRGPRRMHCAMHTIPISSLEPGGTVPGLPELLPRPLEDSFRSITLSKSITHSTEFSSARFSDIAGPHEEEDGGKSRPLVLKNKPPRWHEQLQCWCLNFRGRVTVASVKNFQLIAGGPAPAPGAPAPSQPNQSDHDKILLQFGKLPSDYNLEQQKYAVVFDAGSTGSRVHVFNFDNQMALLPIGEDYEFFLAISPGLSSYVEDPKGGAESLRPLLEQAQAVVPQYLRSTSPLKLGATAGLRLLPGNASEAILEAVRDLFGKESSLDYRPEWVTVLEGSDEGAYMWVAMNYLLGRLGEYISETVGVIDLGGGSVQIAYAISEDAASNAPPSSPQGDAYVANRLILGTKYPLYSHSYLNFGLKAARAQSLNLSGSHGNPCVTNGYQGTYDYNDEVYNVAPPRSGTDLRRCGALTRKVLKVNAPCSHKNCSFDGVWNGGGGVGFDNLYAASYFYDTAAECDIVEVGATTARVRPIAYLNAAKKACSATVDNIKSIFPLVDEGDVAFLCMDLVYEYSLLVDGLGINPYKEITVVTSVEYKDSSIGAAWPLGCAIELLS